MSIPEAAAEARGLSVIIPCYNEEGAIAGVLEDLARVLVGLGRPWEVIVVDDGSADRTAEQVDPGRFRLVRHGVNRGYGAALKTGARAARHATLVIIDADGTYPVERLGEMAARLTGGVEMVIGARLGAKARIPAIRRPAKWCITKLAAYLSGHPIPDLNSGFRVIDRELWMRYERLYPDGFSLSSTLTLAALTGGHVVHFEPIEYHFRIGRSKIRPIHDTINFIFLIMRTVLYFEPLKVFVPVATALLLASLLVGLGSLALSNLFGVGRFLDTTTALLFLTALQLLAIGAMADLVTRRLK